VAQAAPDKALKDFFPRGALKENRDMPHKTKTNIKIPDNVFISLPPTIFFYNGWYS